jgi:hypothetical protein
MGTEFYAVGIAPKGNCAPGENLMLFSGEASLPTIEGRRK